MPVLTKINTNSIAEDAITGDMLGASAYLANTATQNITGTYSENRLYTSDAYTLSGNATINSHLTLSSIKPTDDVVITAGGAYTITGTGVLEGGSMYGRTSLTGMSGELGSAVTGSPSLNLNRAAEFPTGHIIQIAETAHIEQADRGANTLGAFSYPVIGTINNVLPTSKILINVNVCANGTTDTITMYALYDVTNSQYVSNMGYDGHFGCSVDESQRGRSLSFQTLYTPISYGIEDGLSNSLKIELYAKGSSSGVRINSRGDAYGRGTTNFVLMEVAG